jgi:GT2 family glycosyltransferase
VSQAPLVTIAIPAYNPRYFEVALLSAIGQSYENLEILVSDDCPHNHIQQLVTRHGSHSQCVIRVIRNSPGLGGLMNYTQCVVEARGEFIKFLNDDDVLLGDCVKRMVDVFQAHPDVSLVTSRRLLIDESGLQLADIPATCSPFLHDCVVNGADLTSYLADSPMNFIGEPSTVMFRREHLVDVKPNIGCLDGETVRAINDLAMYVNILRHGDLVYLVEPLSCFRKHPEQRQAQSDLLPLWQRAVQVFAGQIRVMGLYQPRPDGKVRCRSLSASGSDWREFSLRQHLIEAANNAALEQRAALSELPAKEAFGFVNDGAAPAQPQSKSSLVDWQAARVFKPQQQLLVNAYLSAHEGGPRLGILLLDLEGNRPKLDLSIKSLGLGGESELALSVVVLSTAEVNEGESDKDLRFLKIDLANYIDELNRVAQTGDFDWLMLVNAGEEFTASGLTMVAQALIDGGQCRAVYGDELQLQANGELGAVFRPGFNLDLLLSFPTLMARHWLFQRRCFVEVGGFDAAFTGALEFELLLRLIERGGMTGLGHVNEPLLVTAVPELADNLAEQAALLRHLKQRGYLNAELTTGQPGRYRINYGHDQQPLVSIIVPTKDQLPMLQRCVESLLEKTRYSNYELLIVDNNSETADACEWLNGVEQMGDEKVRVLRYPHLFNYSAINNMAAREARGEYLVLLNNDTAIISESWLDELLNHAQRPEVGIVGAKLLYPDGRIQHAGVILGLRGPAEHPFISEAIDAPGYMQRLQVDQNYSAVTAACLMIRKSIYQEVGGLDEEHFKVSYNDVDLCLKVGQQGYLTVWTPHAVVMHEGSVSQKQVDPATQQAKRKRFLGEQDAIYAKWLPQLANDPAYNGNLALHGAGFTLENNVGLTWRPLAWRPLPVVLAHNADPWGCGNYRIIKPHQAMKDAGLIDGTVQVRLLEPAELERLAPDVVVYQRQIRSESLVSMARAKRFSSAFKIYELDDYLPNTPLKNAHRANLSKDLVKHLRKGLGYVDRFVVSTPALANALSDYHPDIRVIENRLPLDWWGQSEGVRAPSVKPRVGWAGGIGHQGDLELIADVVRDLANEVDWVFFGMCPDKLKPYVAEFYSGVDIELYPQKLAALNLDLALAPLEDNIFNACKSNLRLLEYGICGFPVIASDIECYRGGLPVTLVKNRYRDWMEAIRAQLAEREALQASAEILRGVVQRDWMLDGANLELWRTAWLPD